MSIFKPICVLELKRVVHINQHAWVNTESNIERMANGKSPMGVDGMQVTLHHIGRNHDAPLATLTDTFHRQNDRAIHSLAPARCKVHRGKFRKERKKVWEAIAWFIQNGINQL